MLMLNNDSCYRVIAVCRLYPTSLFLHCQRFHKESGRVRYHSTVLSGLAVRFADGISLIFLPYKPLSASALF
jgi:hypothetical protein